MKKILLLCLLFAVAQQAKACSCNYGGSFLKMAPNASFIALVKITEWTNYIKPPHGDEIPHAMTVKIIDTYKGKAESKMVTVWGDNGAMCRPYISQFAKGNYYVVAFSRTNSSTGNNYYYINNCGCYWLRYNKKQKIVSGDININQHLASTTWKIKDLKKALQ